MVTGALVPGAPSPRERGRKGVRARSPLISRARPERSGNPAAGVRPVTDALRSVVFRLP
jgi:hypothetical protein